MSAEQGERVSFSNRAGQLGKWFAEYADHHKAKAEQMEALPGSEAWAKVERNLERARYAYTLQDDLADAARHRSTDSELVEALKEVRAIALSHSNYGHAEGNRRAFSIINDIDRRLAALSRAGETK